MTMATLDASVLICTYNRADRLIEMLDSLAAMRQSGAHRWELLLVDNNSTDQTRDVIMARQATFPVPLRYIFEPRQGKSNALNTGIDASSAHVVVFADDDQRAADDWIDEACAPLVADESLAYTGGPIWPIWDALPPSWLTLAEPEMLGPIGMFDYGTEPFIFEERRRSAGGGNMAVRRTLFDRIGGFCAELGRTGHSLLGQEQAEFFCRSRAVGARGLYVPAMQMYHHVPSGRLTKDYFRRWWYWRGVSRARLDRMHPLSEDGVDLASVARVAGVPLFILGDALRDAGKWLSAAARSSTSTRLGSEMRIAYRLGYMRERRRDPMVGAPSTNRRPAEQVLTHKPKGFTAIGTAAPDE